MRPPTLRFKPAPAGTPPTVRIIDRARGTLELDVTAPTTVHRGESSTAASEAKRPSAPTTEQPDLATKQTAYIDALADRIRQGLAPSPDQAEVADAPRRQSADAGQGARSGAEQPQRAEPTETTSKTDQTNLTGRPALDTALGRRTGALDKANQSQQSARGDRAAPPGRNRLREPRQDLFRGFRLPQALNVRRFFTGGRAFWSLLLKNPWILAGMVAVIGALVIGVVALAILSCSTSGSCTGSAADQPANAVTDRADILTALAKAHDLAAKRELVRTRGPELLAWLQQKSDAEPDPTKQAAINRFRTAFQTLTARVEAGIDLGSSDDAKTPSGQTRKQERDEITQAYTEALAAIGQDIPLVIGYLNRVNLQLAQTGRGPYQIPGPGGHFNSGRGNRLHYGYDLAAPVGTPIVVGWSGTIRASQVTWGGTDGFGWAVYVEHAENGKRYVNQYGHLNFSAGQLEMGRPFVQRQGRGERIPMSNGMAVEPGDVIGYVYLDHLDIKWQVIEGNCVADDFKCRFVNWATSPYRDELGRE